VTPEQPDHAALARRYAEQWQLRLDSPAAQGDSRFPVRTAEGAAALLKFGAADSEHLVLRRWAGDGAVRLLRADPHQRVLLTERVAVQTLDQRSDTEACHVVAALYARLHVPALPQLPSATEELARWVGQQDQRAPSGQVPRRLVEQAVALAGDLATLPRDAEVVLHGNLHFSSVHAADREPWLAVDPRPVNGDPHDEVVAMLPQHWDAVADHVRDGIRRRFWTLVDAAGLDEDRARAWVVVRMVRAALEATGPGAGSAVTRYLAVAKAVQD
jgi:streptomycin 6-kinase